MDLTEEQLFLMRGSRVIFRDEGGKPYECDVLEADVWTEMNALIICPVIGLVRALLEELEVVG